MKPAWSWFMMLAYFLLVALTLAADLKPRLTFRRGDSKRIVTSFSHKGVLNYDTLLLSKDKAILYVGARDAILALDMSNVHSIVLKGEIPWTSTQKKIQECIFKEKSRETECFNFIRVLVQLNETHLYTCGTFAFSPTCTYVDLEKFSLATDENGQALLMEGKGLCPFDPRFQNTAIVVDHELYAGTMNNFQGNEPVITRALGRGIGLKTDSFLNWLHADAAFVASFNIPSPSDNDKVYFFFEETGQEFEFFEKLKVSRVARVCKNDIGGERVLQKKWTTFLKAHLSCLKHGYIPYNVIQHAVSLTEPEGSVLFYGVFASQWQVENMGSSAVCVFSLDAIRKAFDGYYQELNKDCSRWVTYTKPVMEPRPGSCSVVPAVEKTLDFMKDHYLMNEKILPIHSRPLLMVQNVRYTRIVLHQARAVSGSLYTVMFMGTDKGYLHKAVAVGTGSHIIEQIQLFEKPEAVQNLLLSPEKGMLYVGYSKGVLQVSLANCSGHRSCADCVLARDPYCAWDGRSSKCRDTRNEVETMNDWLQDIENGNPSPGCQHRGGKGRAMPRPLNDSDGSLVTTLTPLFNSMVRLSCPQASALANYTWKYPEKTIAKELVMEDDKALVIVVRRETLGTYECLASENGYQQVVALYNLRAPNILNGIGDDSIAEEGLQHRAVPVGEPRSYWVQFVTVTVLLSMTLAIAVALAFFTYHDKLKAKSKVQGCSSPQVNKTSGQEKVPLNSGQNPPQGIEYQPIQGAFQEAADSAKSCCVEVEGAYQAIDADNNRLKSGLANRDDSKGAMAAQAV